jgi:hypothetical protein
MDPELVRQARQFQSLLDSKHSFGRAIDASTRQLVQLIIVSAPASMKEPYNPTKEAFQADLHRFAQRTFVQLAKPLPAPTSSISTKALLDAQTKTLEASLLAQTRALKAQAKALDDRILELWNGPVQRTLQVVENTEDMVVDLGNRGL